MTSVANARARLRDLVAIPSVSSGSAAHDRSNRDVIELLADWLQSMKFDCRILPLPSQPEKCNLVATLGQGDDGLVLAGHSDTVPFDEQGWHSDPFRVEDRDGRLYGLGTCDMKGFLALAVEAAAAYQGRRVRRALTIVATADEESSMEGARSLLEARTVRAGHAVVGEPTGLRPVRLHKGILMDALRVGGHAGHSSNPALGHNAIEGMQRIVTALLALRDELVQRERNEAFTVPHATLNLGRISGGDSANRIPAACELHLDLRCLPGQKLDTLRKELRERARQALGEDGFEFTCEDLFTGVPAFETSADAEIVRVTEELTKQRAGTVDFATEGGLFNGLGMQSVILGPGHIEQAHQPDEYLACAYLQPTLDILDRLIQRFCL